MEENNQTIGKKGGGPNIIRKNEGRKKDSEIPGPQFSKRRKLAFVDIK